MTVPATAPLIGQMDPSDVADFYIAVTQGDGVDDMLQTGEELHDFTLSLTSEAVAAGFQILTTLGFEPIYQDHVIEFWGSVLPAHQQDAVFDGGVLLGVEVTFPTTSVPTRVKQRTVAIRVAGK